MRDTTNAEIDDRAAREAHDVVDQIRRLLVDCTVVEKPSS